jgi:endonuclease/exonuclease/phosphatase family metal-dependent hydrolase
MDNRELRIATWNANGILNKKNELEIFLHSQNIDICLISETHMTNQTHIKIHGYNVYHAIHPDNRARGGSAVIIKMSIKQYEDLHLQREDVQLTVIGIICSTRHLKIGAIYLPPRHNHKKDTYKLILEHMGDQFIVGGDFNAKHVDWGSRLTTTKGTELRKAITEISGKVVSTGKPTYWPTDPKKTPDLLDFFVTRKISTNFVDICGSFDLDSDHSAIILTLSETIITRAAHPSFANRTTDWECFRLDLDASINLNTKLKTWEELEVETEKFTTLIQTAACNNTKQIATIGKAVNYPLAIRELAKEKRKARRKWHQTRHPADKNTLNNKSQRLKREIQKLKEESMNSYLQNLTADKDTNFSLWKATKKLRKSTKHVPPIRNAGGPWAVDSLQKATLFADHLAETFTANPSEDVTTPINRKNLPGSISLVTPKEVSEEIQSIASKKSPGYDLITGEIIKNLPKKGIVMLTYLINATFRLKHVPACWKVAEVIMIPKPGKPPIDVKSYRPISLLPVISKVFEKLLLKRLKPVLDKKQIIPDYQFGFRQNHSTIDQVHRITDVIERALEEKQICSAVFLDVAQAFDKVWHDGLISKLYNLLPINYAKLLESYITNRLFRVKQDDEHSTLREIGAGVPQGSVLGPILYLLFTSDMPSMANTTIATFADDTALLTVSNDLDDATSMLQLATNKVINWTKKWRIRLNELKSVHINFTNRKIANALPITINGTTVPYGNTAKYLGITLDAKLKWKEHVKKKRIELGLKYKDYYWLLGKYSKLSTYNKVLIYNQVFKPVWLYGIQIWGCASETNINTIQTFQNYVLRNIVNAPWYVRNSDLHRDLQVPTVKDEIKKYAGKHEARLHRHTNSEVLQLLNNENQTRRLKRRKPSDLV